MAVSGSGGWTPSIKVYIYNRKLTLSGYAHNVPPEIVWMPEDAAAYFYDHPRGPGIYVPTSEGGGTVYLNDLLTEMELVEPLRIGERK